MSSALQEEATTERREAERSQGSRVDQQFTLPDGRKLGYDDFGPLDGKPLLYFHGTPGSRRDIEFILPDRRRFTGKSGIRIIAVDRPGLGLSDFQEDRTICKWPADVEALADGLGIDRFSVLGYSGGSPYAAACALMMPERLNSVGIVSGVAPFTEDGLTEGINKNSVGFLYLSRDKPWLARMLIRFMGLTARFAPKRVGAQAMASLPEPDREMMARPYIARGFARDVAEATRSGPRGAQLDSRLIVTPWDIPIGKITMPVKLWHGGNDHNAPAAMGRYMERTIPNSDIQIYEGEGHISLIVKHIKGIIHRLVD